MTFEECNLCGFCNENCPIAHVIFQEGKIARGQALMVKTDFLDEAFFSCSLCGNCKVSCPVNLDIPNEVIKARERLNEQGKAKNKELITKLQRTGNIFGEVE